MAAWVLLGTAGRRMAHMKGCNLASSLLLSLHRSPVGNSFVLWLFTSLEGRMGVLQRGSGPELNVTSENIPSFEGLSLFGISRQV